MPKTPMRSSPYAGLFKVDATHHAPGTPGVTIEDMPDLGVIVLRGQVQEAGFQQRAEQALGLRLPTTPSSSFVSGNMRVLWISPDEWWILCPAAKAQHQVLQLDKVMAGLFAQVIDNSAGLTCLRLTGGDHLTMLRHLCPYPIDSIAVDQCISTVFPKANVTLVRLDSASTLLVARRSYAYWISQLLERSARPYGLALPAKGGDQV
ncbi:MAG: sarcosine oxidase subunit gamma [Burkholderiaceae bacterium]